MTGAAITNDVKANEVVQCAASIIGANLDQVIAWIIHIESWAWASGAGLNARALRYYRLSGTSHRKGMPFSFTRANA